MPRNVGTIEQGQRAKTETDAIRNENLFRGARPLRKAERRMLERGEPDIYVYNVSTIWQWSRPIAGRGEAVIQRRKAGAKVSEPLLVPGIVVRDYDAGNRNRQMYTEEGIDLVEDILCCSKEMPGLPQNDLTGYGCFYLVGVRFEALAAADQQQILDEANEKHNQKCREKVLEADQLAGSEKTRPWITEPYRLCALHLYEQGDKSMMERTWVAKRGRSSPVSECPYCGFEAKRGLAKCPNCKEVINQELYDSIKQQSAPKTPKARTQPDAG